MIFKADGKTLYVGEKEVQFEFPIDTVLDFQDFCVILLEKITANNVYAIDTNGDILWNISDIIKSPYPEAYVAMGRSENQTIVVISFNGILSIFDPIERQVIKQRITK